MTFACGWGRQVTRFLAKAWLVGWVALLAGQALAQLGGGLVGNPEGPGGLGNASRWVGPGAGRTVLPLPIGRKTSRYCANTLALAKDQLCRITLNRNGRFGVPASCTACTFDEDACFEEADLVAQCTAEEVESDIAHFGTAVTQLTTQFNVVSTAAAGAHESLRKLRVSTTCGTDYAAMQAAVRVLEDAITELERQQAYIGLLHGRIAKARKLAALYKTLSPQQLAQLSIVPGSRARPAIRVPLPSDVLPANAAWVERAISPTVTTVSVKFAVDIVAGAQAPKICQRDLLAELQALSIDEQSFTGLMRARCVAMLPGEAQAFFCARIFEIAEICLAAKPEQRGCNTLAELQSACNRPLPYANDPIAAIHAGEAQGQACGAARAMQDPAMRGKLVRGDALTDIESYEVRQIIGAIENETRIAANNQRRSKCGSTLAPPGPGEKLACSARTAVRALGDMGGTPNCGIPKQNVRTLDWMDQIMTVIVMGSEAFFPVLLAVGTLERMYLDRQEPKGQFAGCQDVCVLLPPKAVVQRVQGYSAWELNSELLPQREGVAGDKQAKTLWEVGDVRDSNDAQQIVCKRFRNWWKTESRDAQLAVYYTE